MLPGGKRQWLCEQYQVTVDPTDFLHSIFHCMVEMAIKNSNNDVGGEVIEMGKWNSWWGLGYIKSVDDIKYSIVDKKHGTPVYVGDIADVAIGPLMRRGLSKRW